MTTPQPQRDRLPDARAHAEPNCTTCRGTGAIEVPDGPESASTEYCHCWWANQPQPLDLDAIEQRTNAATPGPWGYYDGDDYADIAAGYQPTGPGSYTCSQSIARIEADEYEAEDDDEAADRMRADAEFIVNARTDVPALVAEIRRLTAELDHARQQTETLAGIVALHIHTGRNMPQRTSDEKSRAKWAAAEANHLAVKLYAAEINVFTEHTATPGA